MQRTLMAVALAALLSIVASSGIWLQPSVARAQVATPTNDQVLFVGRVPAASGTTVTVTMLHIESAQEVECGSAVTTKVSEPEQSAFELTIEISCTEGAQIPKFCWAEDACYFFFDFPFGANLTGGSTFDLGLMSAQQREENPPPPHVGGGPTDDVGLPDTGLQSEGAGSALPIAALGLLCLIAISSVAFALRRLGKPLS